MPLIYHFGGLRSVIPVGILDSIEFYPGNFSPMYGRATGGIIDVQIKRLQPKKVGGYADVNIFDTGVFLEIPLGNKGGVAVAARRSYFDVLLNAAVPDNAPNSFVTAPRYYDYQLVANYRPAPAHDIRVFVFGSDDRLALLFGNPADLDTEAATNRLSATATFYRATASYKYVPNTKLENNLRVSWGAGLAELQRRPAVLRLRAAVGAAARQLPLQVLGQVVAARGPRLVDREHRHQHPAAAAAQGGRAADASSTRTRRSRGKLDNQVFFSQAAFVEARVEADAALADPARLPRRLLLAHPPDGAAAAADRALAVHRQVHGQGGRGPVRAGAVLRRDRRQLRQPGR